MNAKKQKINYKISIQIIIFGIIGAILGSSMSFKIESENLKKYFGFFLLIIAILEIYSIFKKYIKKKKENNSSIRKE